MRLCDFCGCICRGGRRKFPGRDFLAGECEISIAQKDAAKVRRYAGIRMHSRVRRLLRDFHISEISTCKIAVRAVDSIRVRSYNRLRQRRSNRTSLGWHGKRKFDELRGARERRANQTKFGTVRRRDETQSAARIRSARRGEAAMSGRVGRSNLGPTRVFCRGLLFTRKRVKHGSCNLHD